MSQSNCDFDPAMDGSSTVQQMWHGMHIGEKQHANTPARRRHGVERSVIQQNGGGTMDDW